MGQHCCQAQWCAANTSPASAAERVSAHLEKFRHSLVCHPTTDPTAVSHRRCTVKNSGPKRSLCCIIFKNPLTAVGSSPRGCASRCPCCPLPPARDSAAERLAGAGTLCFFAGGMVRRRAPVLSVHNWGFFHNLKIACSQPGAARTARRAAGRRRAVCVLS